MAQLNLTQEGKDKLQEELRYLKEVRRHEVIEQIRVAKGFGDLSENSEYDDARNEQAKVEGRIQELEEMLKHAVVVVDKGDSDKIQMGMQVTLFNEERNMETVYTVVGVTEADYRTHKISDQSPIGKAIIGHRVGDRVVVDTNAGVQHIVIRSVE